MKRLLLSVGLIGIAFAGYTPSEIQTQQDSHAAAKQADTAQAVALAPARAGAWDRSNSERLGLQRVALRSPATTGIPQPDGFPKGSVEDIFATALPQVGNREEDARPSPESALWVVVIRGAWVHSGPSVSAPIVGHHSPNTELQMIGSKRGWFQVLDPETGERGWILARYYLEPINAPGQKRVAVRTGPVQVTTAPAASEPSRPAPQPKRWVQASRLAPSDDPQLRAVPVRRSGEGVGSILARALHR